MTNEPAGPSHSLIASSLKASPAFIARIEARIRKLSETLLDVFPVGLGCFTLEIGSGHGHFLVKYASLNPDRLHIGIDLLSDRLRKAERKAVTAGVSNVRFLKAEAEEFIGCLPSGVFISEILVLFPDPWPKTRHHKNRLIQPDFLGILSRRMCPGGRLFFRTDHEPYFRWTIDTISNHTSWKILPEAPWVLEEPTVFQKRAPHFKSLVAEVKTPSPAERAPDSPRHPPQARL